MSLLARHGTVVAIPHDDITAGRVKAELETAAVNPSFPKPWRLLCTHKVQTCRFQLCLSFLRKALQFQQVRMHHCYTTTHCSMLKCCWHACKALCVQSNVLALWYVTTTCAAAYGIHVLLQVSKANVVLKAGRILVNIFKLAHGAPA